MQKVKSHVTTNTLLTWVVFSIIMYAIVLTTVNMFIQFEKHRFKPSPHQQQCRSNIVEATGSFVCFDIVAGVDGVLPVPNI